jgi:hypothetical protein
MAALALASMKWQMGLKWIEMADLHEFILYKSINIYQHRILSELGVLGKLKPSFSGLHVCS